MIDNGGAITVHVFAGAFGLIGALFVGKREGRANEDPVSIQNYPVYVIGATLTILGIFGLNIALSPNTIAQGLSAANT